MSETEIAERAACSGILCRPLQQRAPQFFIREMSRLMENPLTLSPLCFLEQFSLWSSPLKVTEYLWTWDSLSEPPLSPVTLHVEVSETRVWMWHLGTRFRGEHSSAGMMVGLDHPRGLFNPQWFYDSGKGIKISISSLHVDLPYGKKLGNLQHVILMCPFCTKYILSGHSRLKENYPSWKRLWDGQVKGLCSATAWSKMDIGEAAEAGCRERRKIYLSVWI